MAALANKIARAIRAILLAEKKDGLAEQQDLFDCCANGPILTYQFAGVHDIVGIDSALDRTHQAVGSAML